MQTILSITGGSFRRNEDSYREYDGFIIETESQKIKIGISNGQSCCESWGYVASEDNTQEFVGAELIDVSVVDEALNKKIIDATEGSETYAMFVNVETSAGLLQFAVYNSHNGYYGHEGVLITNEGVHSESL